MPFALLVVVYGKVGVIYSEVMGIDDDAYGQPRWLSLLKGVCVCVCVCVCVPCFGSPVGWMCPFADGRPLVNCNHVNLPFLYDTSCILN
jgi:hypothetical protein